jgi:hypothetical protein
MDAIPLASLPTFRASLYRLAAYSDNLLFLPTQLRTGIASRVCLFR